MFIILKQNTAKIQVSTIEKKLLFKKVGIDIGQSLTKIAYIDGGNMILSIFPTKQSFNKILEFLKIKRVKLSKLI